MSVSRACRCFSRQRFNSKRIGEALFLESGRSGSSPQNRRDGVLDVIALERASAADHLEQHAAEGKDVGPSIDRLPARLFRLM